MIHRKNPLRSAPTTPTPDHSPTQNIPPSASPAERRGTPRFPTRRGATGTAPAYRSTSARRAGGRKRSGSLNGRRRLKTTETTGLRTAVAAAGARARATDGTRGTVGEAAAAPQINATAGRITRKSALGTLVGAMTGGTAAVTGKGTETETDGENLNATVVTVARITTMTSPNRRARQTRSRYAALRADGLTGTTTAGASRALRLPGNRPCSSALARTTETGTTVEIATGEGIGIVARRGDEGTMGDILGSVLLYYFVLDFLLSWIVCNVPLKLI